MAPRFASVAVLVTLAALVAASGLRAAPEAAPSPAPSIGAAASAAPDALPTGLVTPRADRTPTPRASGTGSGALNFFPFALPTSAPAQNYASFVRTAEIQPGVIDLVRKDEDLFFDLRPENFDRPYIILPSIASGVGGDAFAGRVYDPLVVVFKRVGKRVMWVTPNSRFVAAKGSAEAASLAISVADSVIQASPIVAEDTGKQHVVIAPTIFLTDFEGIGADLGRGSASSLPSLLLLGARPSFGLDASKSYYERTKAFVRNDEVAVNLTFNGPARALPTVPDGRGIPIGVHYSIVAPPEHDADYVPRYADDRVGYFITARKRYDADRETPFERFIDRWNLDAGPIVFTLTNEIPPQYRDTVRRAVLTWNTAFARAGYPQAIRVQDPPSDPAFDPDDARYNSIRWITSDAPGGFAAYSPHVSDPETGQIIRAEVVVDGEALRAVRRGYGDRIALLQPRAAAFAPANPFVLPGESREVADESCDVADASVPQAALGMAMLLAGPNATAAAREQYVQEWLFSTILHEVGHTLGLRHNFEGSTAFTYAQLHDPAFTRIHGTTGSVMDYNGVNIAAPGERQAAYFPLMLGPYDLWAIRYGYQKTGAKTSDADVRALRPILALASSPGLAYATDEDLVAPFDLDPRVAVFDLSSDPLAFDAAQFRIDEDVSSKVARAFRGDTRSYSDLRATFVTILGNDNASAARAARYLGGIYASRAHRGQSGGGAPLRAISRAEQQRAFGLLDRYVLSSRAFAFSPALLNAVVPERFGYHWDSIGVRRVDFPIREVIATIQDGAISEMFNPGSLARIADEELKQEHAGETMSLADLFAWTNAAVFDDVGRPTIAPAHRDLQRRFGDLEMEIAFLPAAIMDQLALPRDVQALARYHLRLLKTRLVAAERGATDTATRAHVEDLAARIGAVLNAAPLRQL